MNYKEKLIEEYNGLKKNIEALNKMLVKWEALNIKYNIKNIGDKSNHNNLFEIKKSQLEKELGDLITCPFELLQDQLNIMKKYLHILEVRIELINTENKDNKNILLS